MKNLYIILFSVLFLACANKEKSTEKTEEINLNNNQITVSKQQFESEKMELGKLTLQDFNDFIKVNGMIDVPPENKASVSTFVGGYVTKIPLLVGDKVKKGQLIAQLKNIEFVEIQQKYLEIAAQLNYLKNEFNRQKRLFDEKITSEKNYLKAKSVYKSSLATYNGLHQKLEMLNINPKTVSKGKITSTINLYAPINGFITKVNVSNGSFISSEKELLEIINTDHIHLELNVFEKDILKIKKHQNIVFKIPESSNKNYNATVYLVGTSIEKNRTIKIHGHIEDEKNNNFISGMFVEASVIYNSKKEIAVPKNAILKTENNAFILVLNSEKKGNFIFDKITIENGLENEEFIEVKNSTSIKDKKILTKGAFMVLSE